VSTESWEPQLPPRDAPPAQRGFPVGLTVVTIIAVALLIGLGVWQLKRLAWKESLLAHIAALRTAQAAAAGPVLDALAHGRDVDFTRVRLTCPGLATAPFLELYGLNDGQIVSRLVSACPVDSAAYRTVLVDRGFIPDTVKARPPVDPAAQTPVELVGVLRRPDARTFVTPANSPQTNRWYSRDATAMAEALGAGAPAPVFLFAETASNPDFKALTPAPVPTDIPNRHLEYAWTWFGLAAALAGVYAAMLFRRTA
jgi:surfeit locus 1 family protein